MTQYINKSAVVAEIEKLFDKGKYHEEFDCAYRDGNNGALYALKEKINALEVKEIELPNPRCPHLDDIVEKVFGMGNLELWEYEEAKQLVLLAKEELLKDLEVKGKEADLEKEIDNVWNPHFNLGWDDNSLVSINHKSFESIAKHFFELGLKGQK